MTNPTEPELGTPFADLVRRGRRGRPYRVYAALAVDPETGYTPSYTLVHKIEDGDPVKISPALVRALAVAAEVSVRDLQIAAAAEYVGLVTTRIPAEGDHSGSAATVAHAPGLSPDDMPLVHELLNRLRGTSGAS
ncbi:hypothetical protein [Streptomyces sp. NPDC059957]|uniref:hypothetical protein n=1 Tax=unclassified Streptomyces TaxID=2593676 RepID=UPI0036642FC1